jgi:hypothetical protein
MTTQYADARQALRAAYTAAPAAIGWKAGGWLIYRPVDGAPKGVAPEMLVLATGHLPLPLSEIGSDVIRSALTTPGR